MKRISLLIISILLLMPQSIKAITTDVAKEAIDPERKINLTIEYEYDDLTFNNIDVELYYIASVDSAFQYELNPNLPADFSSIKLNGIKDQEQWNILEETLENYLVGNDISSDLTTKINNNRAFIEELPCGLYYIKTSLIDADDYKLKFDSFLINLPYLNEDGIWNYDVTVTPKAEAYSSKDQYTVVKVWSDSNYKRLKSIDVEIYRDGNLFESVVLSSNNNWTYSWKVLDGNLSEWNVIEKNIPEDYIVSIVSEADKFIITNTSNPKTGDNIKTYFYIGFTSLILFVIGIIYLIKERKNN